LQKIKIKNQIFEAKDLFKTIIFTINTKEIFLKLNKYLIHDNYDEIFEALLYCFLYGSHTQTENGKILYHGMESNTCSEYLYKNTMFWKVFTSTTENIKIAEKFTNFQQNEGTIFEIRLSKNSSHPHLKIDGDWSPNPIENEVLLWPNFAFRFVTVRKEKWYNYVVLEQDDSFVIFNPSDEIMKNWWKSFVAEKIEMPFYDFFKNMKCRIKDAIDFPKFFNENFEKIVQEINKLFFFSRTEKNIKNIIEQTYISSIKDKLLFGNDRQQNQVNLYHLLIRDMNIVKNLQEIWQPFLIEIGKVICKNSKMPLVGEIFDENKEFFMAMKMEIMQKVEDMMEIYQEASSKICNEFFENQQEEEIISFSN